MNFYRKWFYVVFIVFMNITSIIYYYLGFVLGLLIVIDFQIDEIMCISLVSC